jgi:ferrochelatase
MTTGVVVMAYGTPASIGEVGAYYTDIRRGQPPTAEKLADLVARYEAIGGLSPLAARSAAQRDALTRALDALAPGEYVVALGYKHAEPTIEAATGAVAGDAIERIVGVVLAPHYSAMSVGGYLRRLRASADERGIDVVGIESWATEPAYVEFLAGEVRSGLEAMPERTVSVFTAHSLPKRVLADGDPYTDEVLATATAVAKVAELPTETSWTTAWQSAGRTPEPWLGPDITEYIDRIADEGSAEGVLVCACGFVADHLEVLYDLDIEARRRAEGRGLAFARTACVNDDAGVMGALAARVHAAAGG